jgi:hypothetical protein
MTTGNYTQEVVLYNGYYYGNNTSTTWKKDWTSSLVLYSEIVTNYTYKFNYSGIASTGTRWSIFKYTGKVLTGKASITINNNSHNDKLVYIKYDTPTADGGTTVWFNALTNHDGGSLFSVSRIDGNGIHDTTTTNTHVSTTTTLYVMTPYTNNAIYIVVGIPQTNIDSKFTTVSFTSI